MDRNHSNSKHLRRREQQKRGVLSKLRQPGMCLKRLDDYKWGVFAGAGRDSCKTATVPEQFVRELVSDGLIRKEAGDRLFISKSGLAWLKRTGGGEDRFTRQHQTRAVKAIEGLYGPETAEIDLSESPLAWLYSRKDKSGQRLLSTVQFRAGERLRKDFTLASLSPNITSSWSATSPSASRRRKHGGRANNTIDQSETVLAAKTRLNRALETVGPELSEVLLDVCCFLKGLEASETEHAWPKRSGKIVLKIALSALARHYWPPQSTRDQAASDAGTFWRAPEARPVISDLPTQNLTVE